MNFSYGSLMHDVYKKSQTSGEKTGIFFGVINFAALILYITDDDDGCNNAPRVEATAFSFEVIELRLEPEGICGSISQY